MLTERIKELRSISLRTPYTLSAERALLMTRFYQQPEIMDEPVPIQRAKSFEYLLRHKQLYYQPGELIIGERGPFPKAAPTYPEISLHSEEDLNILDSRKKVSFKVDQATREVYRQEIIPFWKGNTNRDRVFNMMTSEWIDAYEAGVFTEFQEQRAPGHTVLGNKIYQSGLLDIIQDIERQIKSFKEGDEHAYASQLTELEAMRIAANALIKYAERNAVYLEELAVRETHTGRKNEILELAEVCKKVPATAPETLHEALQYYWFVHLGVISELNPWDSFNPGRLDQHLYPFYQNDLKTGRHTKESAAELLQSFWIKFNNHPSPPKIGVTAEESSTYTDFCLINLGGLTSDGSDAVNELSFLLLDLIEEMRLLQPSSMIQVSKKNPDTFVDRAIKIVKTGFGQPSVFNTDAIIQELLNQGKDIVDARNGGASGCVETGAFGTEAYILTGYFNLVKVLEITMHNGTDPRTGKQIGLSTGKVDNFKSFEDFQMAFGKQLNYFIDIKCQGNLVIEQLFASNLPVPFLSLFIDDCIKNGKDYNEGGARYNTSYIQGVGLGSITDIFTAIKFHVFDKQTITLPTLLRILERDFEGYEDIRSELIYNTPKYGNDSDEADQHAVWVFELFHDAVNGRPNYRGGKMRINMLPTTSHVYFGSVTGATADGRHAGEPLSEGISPFQGMDRKGPTAVIRSAAKFDHLKTGGTLLNQKFTPDFFKDDTSIRKLTQLVRAYFGMMGHHIQFNVVSAKTLKDAQMHPEKYQDLIVRVAGYSDYFNDLGEALQNEIIRRTEQGE
ncbi:trans-4-hydroxy-L-proline dehydratase [Bacteroidota bacterium]